MLRDPYTPDCDSQSETSALHIFIYELITAKLFAKSDECDPGAQSHFTNP